MRFLWSILRWVSSFYLFIYFSRNYLICCFFFYPLNLLMLQFGNHVISSLHAFSFSRIFSNGFLLLMIYLNCCRLLGFLCLDFYGLKQESCSKSAFSSGTSIRFCFFLLFFSKLKKREYVIGLLPFSSIIYQFNSWVILLQVRIALICGTIIVIYI